MIFNFSIRVFCLFFYFSIFFKGVGTRGELSNKVLFLGGPAV